MTWCAQVLSEQRTSSSKASSQENFLLSPVAGAFTHLTVSLPSPKELIVTHIFG